MPADDRGTLAPGDAVIHVPTRTHRADLGKVRALAIGYSAESLPRILHLIEHLPVGELAVFIAQHILDLI